MNAIVWGRWVARLFQQRRAGNQARRRLSVETLEDRVTPTTFIWTGQGGNNNWSTGANWQGGVAPTTLAAPDLVFNSVTPRMNTTNDILSLSVKSITISASNYTLNGAKLFIDGNVTVGSGATNERMNMDVELTAPSSFTVNNVADLTLTGKMSGAASLTKVGVGSLFLTNDNAAYTGPIDVQTGRLIISHVDALGSTTAATTVEANAQLQIRNIALTISEPLILNGPGPINDGALLNFSGNSTWAGTITLDSDASFGVAGGTLLTVPGLITDTGFTGGHNLTKVGTGQLIFNRAGGNTYRGQTVINSGILTIRDPQSLGAGSIFGTPQNGTPQSATIVNFNSTINEAGTLQLELTGTVAGNDPNAVLRNPALPFDPLSNPVVGFQVFNDQLILNGPGFNGLGALHNLTGNNIWNGAVTLGGPLPNTSDVTVGVAAATALTVSGVVGDDPTRSGADIPDLHKILPGKLIFDNANTYRGNTLIEFGILTIRDSRALGSPAGGTTTVVPSPGFDGPAALEYEVDRGLDGTSLRTQNRNLGFDSVRGTGQWQEIAITGTSGNFTLSFNGETTGNLPFDASAALVQAALGQLSTVGPANVVVTQNANVYRVTFVNALDGVNVPLLVAGGTAGAVINDAYGLTVSKNIFLNGMGVNGGGALRSVTGLNTQLGTLSLGTTGDRTGSIGVESDPRPGHPSADDSYFTSDYSLTIGAANALQSSQNELFVKVRGGHLVLPQSNNTLDGPTRIAEGWITSQDSQAFGRPVVNPALGETVQPNQVTVVGGAALHLRPRLPGQNLNVANNFILAGQGINHPFAILEEGAVLNLGGNNQLTGDLVLIGQVGIGVEDAAGFSDSELTTRNSLSGLFSAPPAAPILFETASSSPWPAPFATHTHGDTFEVGQQDWGPTLDEEVRLQAEFNLTNSSFTGAATLSFEVLTITGNHDFGIDLNAYDGNGQVEVSDYSAPIIAGPLTSFNSGSLSVGQVIQVDITTAFNMQAGAFLGLRFQATSDPGDETVDNTVTFGNFEITLGGGAGGIAKLGSKRLNLQGDGIYTGDVDVVSGTLRVQNDSALGRNSSGTFDDPTTQTFSPSETTVAAGGALQLDTTIPQNSGGFAAGVQIWDERLVLNGAAQQVQVSGSAGTFSLTFQGQTTTALPLNATALQVQAALNALSTINGAARVTKNDSIFTVVLGGALAGLNNPLLTATTSPAPGNLTVKISGANSPLSVLAEDNLWRGPLTLASNTTIDVADDSRLILNGPIDDTANLTPVGSGLTLGLAGSGNTGELVLAGANSYRGTTLVNQGVLTITNNQALGGIGGAEVQTVTIGGAPGTFTLTFDGKTTAPLQSIATAVQVQTALNALSTIGGAGGSVSVTKAGNVFTITFGGTLTGADQPALAAAGAGGTTADVATTTEGFGGTVVTPGAQLQMQGSVIVGGESLTVMGAGVSHDDVPDAIPVRWFTIGSAPVNGVPAGAGANASTGRVTGVAVDPSDPSVIYISTAGGGAWKTKNGGRTWTPLFDNTAAMFSGAIAVAPSNPRVLYFGTGEPNNSGDSYYGSGVYKSTDSGRTWTLLTNVGGGNPLLGTAVSRIVVDPTNADRVYVATGDLSVNENAGPGSAGVWVFSNNDTWINLTAITSTVRAGILPTPNSGFPGAINTPGPDDDFRLAFPDTNAVYSDLSFGLSTDAFGGVRPALYMALGTPTFFGVPTDSNAVYRLLDPASAGTAATTHWYVGDGNPANNGTHTYSQGGGGAFPRAGVHSTIKVAASGQTVYALITNGNSGAMERLVKSTDGGKTWADTAADPPNMLNNQGEYDSAIIVSPTDPNIVVAVGCYDFFFPEFFDNGAMLSIDGGATWVDISIDAPGNGPHTDYHSVVFDSQGRIVVGTDGGVWRYEFTSDPTDAPTAGIWTNLNGGGMAITTFNGISQHPTNPDIVLGGSQDNGTEKYTGSQAWTFNDGGDGGEVYFDPSDPNIAYHVQNGFLRKSTDGGDTWFDTSFSINGLYFSFVVDPVNPQRLVLGGGFVFESLNGGQTFTNLVDSLFFAVRHVAIPSYQGDYQFDPAFPLVGDRGASTYDSDTIYATDGFVLVVTKDHAETWTQPFDRTPPGNGLIESITVDPRNRDTVFVVMQGPEGSGDNGVWKSTDAGRTWTDITANLVDIPGLSTDIPLWKVVIDPRDGSLYLGSDQGVWVLPGGSGSWERLGIGLPNVQVKELDLNLNLNILTVGTYGRSAFQFFLDDVRADSGALRATSGHSSWTGPIRLAGETTIAVDGSQDLNGAAAATLDIVGVISDKSEGNFKLTKIGGGTLTLSGANTYGGLTEAAEGVLGVNNPDALGVFRAGADITAQGGTLVDAGATLQMQADLEAEPIVLNGHGVSPGLNGHNVGALRNISGDNTYTGVLTLGSSATIGVDSGSQLTIGRSPTLAGTGTIAGAADLTKELTGTLVLAEDNAGFAGGTAINQGALRVEHAGALGTGAIGTRVIDGGQIQLRTPTTGPNANQPVVVNEPLTLSGTGIFGTGAILNVAGNNAWNGPILLDVLPGFSPDTFPFGAVSINVAGAADTLTLGGPIAEFVTTGLSKIGPGKLVLSNSNAYSGATEVVQGSLNVRNAGAVGIRSGTASVQRVVTLSAGKQGHFILTFNGISTSPTALDWAATPELVQQILEALSTIGTGNIASVTREEVQTLTKNGAGEPETGFVYTVVFGGSLANTPLQLTASGLDGMAAAASVAATGGVNVRVAAGAALELDATGNTPGFTIAGHKLTLSGTGLSGQGALDNLVGNNGWNGPLELTGHTAVGAGAGTALTLAGGTTGAAFELTKVDTGTLIFATGGNNQARTIVDDGIVEVNGALGAVRLAGGTLGGIGTVGAISSNPGAPGLGGTVSPGLTFPSPEVGTLTAAGTVLNSSNVLFVNLTNPGTPTSDLLQVAGSIDLGNAALAGLVAANVSLGDSFTIVTAGSVVGHFAGQPTTATHPDALSATIAYIDNVKFVVNYLPTSVILSRELANTAMSLAPTIAAPVYGQRELFVATFTPESPNLAVSGTVDFIVIDPDGNNFLFPVAIDPLTNTATFDPSAANPDGFGAPLRLGTYTVSAFFNGIDGNGATTFNPVAAGPIQTTVTEAASTTALTSSLNPSGFGANVTFTATVSSAVINPAPGTLGPIGTVTFRDLSTNTTLGTITLVPGAGAFSTAALTISSLIVGSHSIRATYNGDGSPEDNYAASQSPSLTQIVTRSTTTTDVTGAPNPSTYGQPVTFTATVNGSVGGTVTGNVTFRLGTIVLGTSALNAAGVATFTTGAFQLPGGQDQLITATYNGDGNFNTSAGSTTQDVNPAPSATTVTTSGSPSGFGQPVTFTATVSSTLAGDPRIPSGLVTFILNGTTVLGVGTLSAAGIATFTTSGLQLPIGTHTVSAEYDGDATYLTSTGSVSQRVTAAATTTNVAASPTQGTPRRAVTFTANVGSVGTGSGTPTGEVEFRDLTTGKILGSATLDENGNASLTAHLGGPTGNHTVRAQYQGDGNNSPSSDVVNFRVFASGTRTSVAVLRTSGSPSVEGFPVTFTATVRDTGALPRRNPGGSIWFFDKTTQQTIGYANLVAVATGITRASITTSDLTVGTHEIVARYSGNAAFRPVNSPDLDQIVKVAPTRTSSILLAEPPAQPDPSVFGQSLSFTATVTDTGAGLPITPAGTVTFIDATSDTEIATVNLVGTSTLGTAMATLTTNVLSVGLHNIVARFNGDTDFAPGPDSNAVSQLVTQATSTMSLTSSANPSRFGQAVTFRATMGSATGGGVPTGTVRFFVDGNQIGSGTINAAGLATFTTNSLAVGTYTVTAIYDGDGNFTTSNGTLSGGQTVNKAATTATLKRSTSEAGAPLTLTATMLAVAPGGGVPAGTVTFFIDGINRGTINLSNGVAALFLSNGLSQGSHTIVVQYSGSDSHNASNTTFFYNFGGRTG